MFEIFFLPKIIINFTQFSGLHTELGGQKQSINHIMLVLNRHQYRRYFDQSLQDTEP